MKHLYDVDTQDTVITLADWYHKPALQHAFTDIADSTLINGLGRSWVNTTASELAVVKVTRNVR
jgi:iron transport multicopper oxidase